MAIMRKHKQEKDYVQVSNKTALAPETRTPEKSISLQALGLIVNLWSYDVESYEVHKTQLYNRFTLNKETSVKNAWAELVEARYILEYKVRVGKKYEYEYIYNIVPFSPEQIADYDRQITDEYGKFWGLDFQDLKMETSKCGPQKPEILKTKEKKDLKKEKLNKKNNKLASLDDMNSVDLILKKIFPEVPFDEIKNKLIDDASRGEVLIDTKNRYQGLLNSRIEDWKRSKSQNKPYSPLKTNRKEILPEWFDEEQEPNTGVKKHSEVSDEEKAELQEILKSLKNKD